MKLSIIIPTLNEENFLPKLLQCLKQQTFTDFEVIVSDAQSKDATRKIAQDFGAQVVEGGKISIGRNAGAKIAKGDYLVFIDADCEFGPDFLEDCMNTVQDKNAGILLAPFKASDAGLFLKISYFFMNIQQRVFLNTRFSFATGAAMLFPRQKFLEVGGFDETATRQGDSEIFERCKKLKFKQALSKSYIYPSSRRYKKVGTIRTFSTYFLGTIAMSTKLNRSKRVQKFLDRLSGGWGNW